MTPRDRVEHAVERAGEVMADKVAEIKPHLRGWLHAATAPIALAATRKPATMTAAMAAQCPLRNVAHLLNIGASLRM